MPKPLTALFVDCDSYFASVEQHLDPALRGRPVGVAPVMAESSCCIAASYEAKAFGVKTGTRISDARVMCPGIAIVESKPPEYIRYHHRIIEAVEDCIHIEAVLRRCGGNRTRAAEILGIERKSLYRKAERLGIALDREEEEP